MNKWHDIIAFLDYFIRDFIYWCKSFFY